MSIVYEHVSEDGNERFHVDLGDGRNLLVNVTEEGVIMDVFQNRPVHDKGAVVPIPKGRYVSEHLGTVGMTFEEWADWIGADTV